MIRFSPPTNNKNKIQGKKGNTYHNKRREYNLQRLKDSEPQKNGITKYN